ncbi:MAG: hypothetical protein Q9180_005698 [Flavoplaca navasiana]
MRVKTSSDFSLASDRGRYREIVDQYRPELKSYESIYRDLHSHPELSQQEQRTSSIAAHHLKFFGYSVHEYIGGYGLIGVIKNGHGPTVLLRADMDALPVHENTGLGYASKKTMIDSNGVEVPVMHACGHDVHVTCLMGAAELLYLARFEWRGTLICLFQPAEEFVSGAQAMVDDGLYSRFDLPKPDIVLGQHVFCIEKAGAVSNLPAMAYLYPPASGNIPWHVRHFSAWLATSKASVSLPCHRIKHRTSFNTCDSSIAGMLILKLDVGCYESRSRSRCL